MPDNDKLVDAPESAEVDASGLGIGGDIKEMYVASELRRVRNDGGDYIVATMKCGTVVVSSVSLLQYRVMVHKDGKLVREYEGDSDSDAAKVFRSHSFIFEKAFQRVLEGNASIRVG